MRLSDIFKQSRLNNRAEYVAKERAKAGVLRAGSSGIMSENGEVAGHCVRKAHLRQKGVEIDPPTEDKLIMFDLGYASEDIVYNKLKSALPEGHIILREEEIPIEWTTSNGTKVTGRPDMVICRTKYTDQVHINPTTGSHSIVVEKTPILGLELKSVHSLWTARDVVFNRKPKLSNLIQAAHYMWKLNVPYKLVYSGYSQLGQGMAGNEWITKLFPRMGDPGSEYVEYNEEKGTIKHIRQFEIVYDLRIDAHGRVHYKLEDENDSQWTATIVTTKYIEEYFEKVSTMESTKDLGPRPTTLGATGDKLNYKDCDYCPLKATCDKYESKGYDKWVEEVLKVSETSSDK